jgi:glucokinase
VSLFLGLDVGGTKTEVGVGTAAGVVLGRVRVATAELRAGGDPLAALTALGRALLTEVGGTAAAGVGAALPGPVDPREGRMLAAPTIPELAGLPLPTLLSAAFGCPARLENDANACALAESRWGAGVGYDSLAYVTVSTGIGGGFVLHGRLFRGAGGTAAEFGHQVLDPAGPPCDCGSRGCLEALASGRGIARRGAALGLPDAEAAAAAARAGDPSARALWAATAEYLGQGIGNLINILDPAVVVLGGGVALGAADLLLEPVREVVRARCMPSLARPTPILPAGLGPDLGILSALSLVAPGGDPPHPP